MSIVRLLASMNEVGGPILSYATAPNEDWVIFPRIDLMAKLTNAGVDELETEIAAGLRNFVTFEGVDATAKFYVNADPATRARLPRIDRC